jgi:hypothetical protein
MLKTLLNLEWIYETPRQAKANKRLDIHTFDLIPPPPDELTALLTLSRRGNMLAIQQRAVQIAQMGEKYGPFANKLERLARGYEVKKIRDFIDQFVGED